MRIQRYYSSVREELSSLSEDALTLLDKQDYVGFFKSCGPNYVRSVRRAQEITSIFDFASTNNYKANKFSQELQLGVFTNKFVKRIQKNSKYSDIVDSLKINVHIFGLGLGGDNVLVPTAVTLEGYQEMLRAVFLSFTQNEDVNNIGKIYAVEFVPWVDNTGFQVAAKVYDEDVTIPLRRSMIPKAIESGGGSSLTFGPDQTNRNSFQCKSSLHNIDKYGYCCEHHWLWNPSSAKYETEHQNITRSTHVCRPARQLDKSAAKNNMANNGEFVTHLDSIIQNKGNQLYTLQKCLTSLKSFSSKYDYHIVKTRDSAKYDADLEMSLTMKEFKISIDPLDNYSLLEQLGQELEEFTNMYYRPCIHAIYGMNIGNTAEIDPQYFMAYGWLAHHQCNHLSCLGDNMRWDRENGGCIPSVAYGATSPLYGTNKDYCETTILKEADSSGNEQCKHDQDVLQQRQIDSNICWTSTASPFYLMDHYCLPEITSETANIDEKAAVNILIASCPAHNN